MIQIIIILFQLALRGYLIPYPIISDVTPMYVQGSEQTDL
jgi:hypothetical protein